jgi:polyphenol oxidase
VLWTIEEIDIGRIVIPPLLPEGLALLYTTIDFDGRLNDDIAEQLMRIIHDRFGVDATLATCTQVHGKSAVQAPFGKRWRECDSSDALWSSTTGSALGIKGADCLPVSLADMKNGVMANIHSGWRGAVQRITLETLDVLERETLLDATAAQVWLGPSIRVCCFEVGEEVVDELRASYADAETFVDRSRPRPHVDLAGLTTARLVERGFPLSGIHDSGLCTRCEGSIFHSFRRDAKRGGRNLAIVAR